MRSIWLSSYPSQLVLIWQVLLHQACAEQNLNISAKKISIHGSLAIKDVQLWFHLGVRRLLIKLYSGFYCCLKTETFWIVNFFPKPNTAMFFRRAVPKSSFLLAYKCNTVFVLPSICCLPEFLSAAFILCEFLRITYLIYILTIQCLNKVYDDGCSYDFLNSP